MENIYSTDELEALLGENLKTLRLQKNLDRKSLCNHAGISMNALRHLETGVGANVKTLIRVVRALNREDWLAAIAPKISINPLHMGRLMAPARQRARTKRTRYAKKEKKGN